MSPGLGHCQGLTMLDWRERGREGRNVVHESQVERDEKGELM